MILREWARFIGEQVRTSLKREVVKMYVPKGKRNWWDKETTLLIYYTEENIRRGWNTKVSMWICIIHRTGNGNEWSPEHGWSRSRFSVSHRCTKPQEPISRKTIQTVLILKPSGIGQMMNNDGHWMYSIVLEWQCVRGVRSKDSSHFKYRHESLFPNWTSFSAW